MKIITSYAQCAYTVRRSKFLSEAFPVSTQEEARQLLKEQKEKYKDATHVVHAFVIGKNGEILGCSDDGEPAGTAGKPALAVLKNSGLTNIFVSITRWFGGVLLGTGGLVKAYGDGVKFILEEIEKKGFAEPLVEKSRIQFSCSYAHYETVNRFFDDFALAILDTQYAEEVTVFAEIPSQNLEDFAAMIFNQTLGKTTVRVQGQNTD